MSSPLKTSQDWGYWADRPQGDLVAPVDDWGVGDPDNPNLTRSSSLRLAVREPRSTDTFELSSTDVRQRFERDRLEWQMKTETMSSLTDMVMLPEYQRIVGLGPAAVPLIIESLRFELDHWFWALTSIVGWDHGEGAETMGEAADMWLAWYDSNASDD